MLLTETHRGPGRHRRQHSLGEALAFVAAGVRAGFAKLVDHDLPLVAASGLLVMGTMFSALATVAWVWLDRTALCWGFALTGSASWLFGLAIFIVFPPTASPRHSRSS